MKEKDKQEGGRKEGKKGRREEGKKGRREEGGKEGEGREEGRKGNHGIFCSSAMNTYLHCHNNVNANYGFN